MRYLLCFSGQQWVWDDVKFEMLYPDLAGYDNAKTKDNNRSCVLRVSSQYGSLLLPGDIEKEAEAYLLNTNPEQLFADVLVVPHHGSKTSSTTQFINAVNPSAAIFTVGYRNRFGHPKQEVLSRYQVEGSKMYRSDDDGAVLLDFSRNKGIGIIRWRQQDWHYWQE